MIENEQIERYKKQIDEDFEKCPKDFIKRLIQLEKSWIRNISHKVMKTHAGFVHDDRRNLRKELMKHLINKVPISLKWKHY